MIAEVGASGVAGAVVSVSESVEQRGSPLGRLMSSRDQRRQQLCAWGADLLQALEAGSMDDARTLVDRLSADVETKH